MKKDFAKKLTRTAILLAVMLAVQLFKNISPYVSGPLVNVILIIATLGAGLWSGIVLSVIAPVSSFLITQAPIMPATHFTLFPVIMIGNIIIVLGAYLGRKTSKSLITGLAVGSVLKWLAMWGAVSLVIIPIFSGLNENILIKITQMFTHLQLYAAILGSIIAYIIWPPIKKALKIY